MNDRQALAEAIARIRDQKPHIKKRRMQQVAFAEVDRQVAVAIPAVTKGERRPLAVDVMRGAVGPMVRFIKLKRRMLA